MTNRERYKKMFDKAAASGMERMEAEIVKRNSRNRWHMIYRAAAIAIAVLVSAGGLAYAAARYYGILDFNMGGACEMQEEAVSLIEMDLPQETEGSQVVRFDGTAEAEQASGQEADAAGKDQGSAQEAEKELLPEAEAENDLFTCEVKEALRDSETITLVYEVSAKEKGKYLFVPEDADPEDRIPKEHGKPWDYAGELTIREYAEQNNLTVVHIGGGIDNREELGVVEWELEFLSPEDDVMDVCVRSTLESSYAGENVVCVATAWKESEAQTIIRDRVAFPLTDRSEAVVTEYVPAADSTYSQALDCTFTRAEVIQTALGTYVDLFFTREQEGLWEEELSLQMADGRGEQTGGFIVETEEEKGFKERIELGKMEIGASFDVTIRDLKNEKEVLQTLTFTRP